MTNFTSRKEETSN